MSIDTHALPVQPSITGVRTAEIAIRRYIRRTPVIHVDDAEVGAGITLKLELLQHAGSFKTRGAFANLLLRHVPAGGVIAASGGNHGVAVAYAARTLGVPATIFVPGISSPAKIARIKKYGAKLVVTGQSYADALAASEQFAGSRDLLSVHAFDQPETIAGQGTLALELEQQVPEAATVLVPVGGGGLLAGVVAWFGRRVRIVPVEPMTAPTLTRALAAGAPVDVEVGGIAADSLAPRRVGHLVFDVVKPVVNGTVLVSDDDIRGAQRWLWDNVRVAAEPGGAAAFAGVLSGRYIPAPDESVTVLVSGGNVINLPLTETDEQTTSHN